MPTNIDYRDKMTGADETGGLYHLGRASGRGEQSPLDPDRIEGEEGETVGD